MKLNEFKYNTISQLTRAVANRYCIDTDLFKKCQQNKDEETIINFYMEACKRLNKDIGLHKVDHYQKIFDWFSEYATCTFDHFSSKIDFEVNIDKAGFDRITGMDMKPIKVINRTRFCVNLVIDENPAIIKYDYVSDSDWGIAIVFITEKMKRSIRKNRLRDFIECFTKDNSVTIYLSNGIKPYISCSKIDTCSTCTQRAMCNDVVGVCKFTTKCKYECPDHSKFGIYDGPDRVDKFMKIGQYLLSLYNTDKKLLYKQPSEEKTTKNSSSSTYKTNNKLKSFEEEFGRSFDVKYIHGNEHITKGHHNSPTPHIRKGHFRHYKSGNVVWIESCTVGNVDETTDHKLYDL